jgi:hypothetical protein
LVSVFFQVSAHTPPGGTYCNLTLNKQRKVPANVLLHQISISLYTKLQS